MVIVFDVMFGIVEVLCLIIDCGDFVIVNFLVYVLFYVFVLYDGC